MAITLLDDVMNPEPQSLIENKGGFAAPAVPVESLAKRLDTLDGKTIYLVDIGYGGSYKFLQAVERWFNRNMPSVTTVRKTEGRQRFQGRFARTLGGDQGERTCGRHRGRGLNRLCVSGS